jgi:hypothetical protein
MVWSAFIVDLNHDRALSFCFDAFSSREPDSTSLKNALVSASSECEANI